jgi:hypothetical protein
MFLPSGETVLHGNRSDFLAEVSNQGIRVKGQHFLDSEK